jgi:hypothetical protein
MKTKTIRLNFPYFIAGRKHDRWHDVASFDWFTKDGWGYAKDAKGRSCGAVKREPQFADFPCKELETPTGG